jgi:hypothetical protein
VLVTNHVLAGAVIGVRTGRPVVAFGVGVASHLAMDVVPHWGVPEQLQGREREECFLRVARRDGVVGLAAMGAAFGLARGRRRSVLAGMVGAALLDLEKPARHFFGVSPFPAAVDRFHADIQVGREHSRRMPQEVAVAAGLAVAVAVLCAARRPRGG